MSFNSKVLHEIMDSLGQSRALILAGPVVTTITQTLDNDNMIQKAPAAKYPKFHESKPDKLNGSKYQSMRSECNSRGEKKSSSLSMHLKLLSTLFFSSLFSQQAFLHLSFTLLALFSQVVFNAMALCPPDGKIQMERSVVHREMIM